MCAAEHLAVLDVGVLRVELVVLRALRAVDCRVQRSFHGLCFCGDIIADCAEMLRTYLCRTTPSVAASLPQSSNTSEE